MSKKQSTAKPITKALTLREEAFVASYIQNGGNATGAGRSAGYKGKSGARVTAHRLLTRANISAEIAKRRAELRRASDVSAQEVIQTLASHLRSDITELLGASGSFDLAKVRSSGLGRLIKSMDLKRVPPKRATARKKARPATIYVSKLQLHSAQSAAVQLCKVLGIEQERGKNRNDPERLRKLLEERIEFGIEGFRRGGVTLTRRDVLEMFEETPENAGELYPLIQAELASEAIH